MRRERGTILITSLWILVILSLLAMGIGFRVSLEARLAKYNIDGSRALYMAKAGTVKSVYRLSKKPTVCDSLYECGTAFSPDERSDPDKQKGIFSGSLGGGAFSVGYTAGGTAYPGMADEERRININAASQKVLEGLLTYFGEDPVIAAAIVEWRSPGPGLNDGYYESLASPYKCKHESFSASEELLLVKGIDRKTFNKIKGYVTVFGDTAKLTVNMNTAPKAVLSSLIMAAASADKVTADFFSERIIDFRNGPDGKPGTKDDNVFNADMNIELIVPELSAAQAAELKNSFTTASRYFRIESQGIISATKVTKKTVSICKKDQGKAPALIYYREY